MIRKYATLTFTTVFFLAHNLFAQIPLKNDDTSFVVIVPSYNNAGWYEKNLDSIFFQEYNNYRVIYIDDCSSDGTAQLVQHYIDEHNCSDVITLICNDTRHGALFNTWKAVWQCDDHEVVLVLDGDDWFAHEHAMKIVDAEYKKNYVMTYGQFKRFPSGAKGQCRQLPRRIIEHNAYREYDWVTSALRTFYAGLFKSIALKDLLYDGKFFFATADMAYMFPMLEMAHGNVSFIENELYVYNNQTSGNDHKVRPFEQIHSNKVIRMRKKYAPKNSILACEKLQTVEIILHATSPKQLIGSIANIKNFFSVYDSIRVIHANDRDYDFIRQIFSEITFYSYEDNFKQILSDCLQDISSEYAVCLDDSYTFTFDIDCKTCVEWMQRTHAYAFSLTPLFDYIQRKTFLFDNVVAWQLQDSAHDSRIIGQWSAAVYRHVDLIKQINDIEYNSYKELQQKLSCAYFDPTDTVLGFDA